MMMISIVVSVVRSEGFVEKYQNSGLRCCSCVGLVRHVMKEVRYVPKVSEMDVLGVWHSDICSDVFYGFFRHHHPSKLEETCHKLVVEREEEIIDGILGASDRSRVDEIVCFDALRSCVDNKNKSRVLKDDLDDHDEDDRGMYIYITVRI